MAKVRSPAAKRHLSLARARKAAIIVKGSKTGVIASESRFRDRVLGHFGPSVSKSAKSRSKTSSKRLLKKAM
jgi:hypothetical protein